MIPSKVLGSKIHTMVVQLHYFFFFFLSIFPFCLAKHLQISFVPNALYDVIYLLLDESNLYVRKITLHENHSGFLYIFFPIFILSCLFFLWTLEQYYSCVRALYFHPNCLHWKSLQGHPPSLLPDQIHLEIHY